MDSALTLKGFVNMLLVQTARKRWPALSAWQQEALAGDRVGNVPPGRSHGGTAGPDPLTGLAPLLQVPPTTWIPLVQRIATMLQQTTTWHQLEVRTTHSSLVANIDPGRIEQVLTNLIGNAIKYSPQGGTVTITVLEETAARAIGISVQDSGIGIPKHQHALIFGRFMRADNALAWGISGTGLGLYICARTGEQLGGHLWFESEEGAGSTFFSTLPIVDHPENNEQDHLAVRLPPCPPENHATGSNPGRQ